MVTPVRAWSGFIQWTSRSQHSALRIVTIGALLFAAFQLHERANRLEQRERLLQQQMAAISRQTQEHDERVRSLGTLPAPLERVAEASATNSTPFLDGVVHRASHPDLIRPVALKTTDR
ncbi:hypothetical protein SAMN05444166_6846 [Singulisphaera sp. GP187]|uniref:hypothetical protein n=1 Tax=Singulisphaera sp. GP187 TaxID=1882752 RepID=UPI00092701FC|nr:hypothetical protein [Singulisphaera sp. GP187]SIO61754.1 hypothetical protein SAMN05444166_6846 [Singulisphaera sp. GP187]